MADDETHIGRNNEEREEDENRRIMGKALEGAAVETVQRFGSAIKEHLAAYAGDREKPADGNSRPPKTLKSIAETPTSNEFREQNIAQQAGFSAEVESAARKNADNIIAGKDTRFKRYDDVKHVSNDPIVDIVEVDDLGKPIIGSEAQMKFVGSSPKELLNALKSKEYAKYRDAGVIMDIPDDYYDVLMGDGPDGINEQIRKRQVKLDGDRLTGKNSPESIQQQIDDLKQIKKSLRKSGLTKSEALYAREHPKRMVAKDVAKVANKAGLQQARNGALIGGGVSLIRNMVACINGSIEPAEAARNVGVDAGLAAAFGYVTAFSGAAIKGAMQNASSEYLRSLSRTNVAATMVSTVTDVSKVVALYCRGEITGAACIERLGQQGMGQLGGVMGVAVAMAAIPADSAFMAAMVGMAGSTLGYAAAVAIYEELSTALHDYELAKEERIRVERECAEAVELIRQYRRDMSRDVENYLATRDELCNRAFDAMDQALISNDIDGYLAGNAEIQESLGYLPRFRTQQEFDDLMASDDNFVL
ncbi:hypothetical protein [Bifidobacterium longum]|uniref:hypothetical protein n=1 Tax=Bifidobacterium longum TaxID=216816 RepID=UPI00202506D3|nr:hypothetical protein [Bifidobacterium longum]MDW3108275.1 hypothetical protein [Bifidobacterium longum]MDW3157497.1 hypothetical protein [Bifidobacterium longum]